MVECESYLVTKGESDLLIRNERILSLVQIAIILEKTFFI